MTMHPNLPPVLDVCCGSKMFWFDRADSRAVFVDKRKESHTLPDKSSSGGSRELIIDPDYVADFTNLPFPDNTFALVVFDPPHFKRNGSTGWVALKYGTLQDGWQEMLRDGFAECFRVLRPEGVLIFKWCDVEIPVSRILELTPEKPLFGHRSGKQQKTHWIAFMKHNAAQDEANSSHLTPEMHAQFIKLIRIDLLRMSESTDNPNLFEVIKTLTWGFVNGLVRAYLDKAVTDLVQILIELQEAIGTARAEKGPSQFDEPLQKIADALATLKSQPDGSA